MDPEEDEHHRGEGHSDDQDDHERMVADFRRPFGVSLVLTVPILLLSPFIQALSGLEEILAFPGDRCVQFVLTGGCLFLWRRLLNLFHPRPAV
jgi:P-type Cu2+ transporter